MNLLPDTGTPLWAWGGPRSSAAGCSGLLRDPHGRVLGRRREAPGSCLAITGTEDLGGETLYRLGYPNREVRQSLSERLRRAAGPDASRQEDA